jgi:serine/threonine protein kinase
MADIWACGIITNYMLTGKHPFISGEDKTEEIKDKILNFKDIKFSTAMSPQA